MLLTTFMLIINKMSELPKPNFLAPPGIVPMSPELPKSNVPSPEKPVKDLGFSKFLDNYGEVIMEAIQKVEDEEKER